MPDKMEKFAPIARKDDPKLYAMMDELVAAHHSDVAEAKIVLVQEYEVKEDRDGILRWGKAKKVGPLEREFHDHDFIILLNWKVWQELPEIARRALLDHELTHCASAIDDQTGETTYYVRKHDLEEFNEIVSRYGLWREGVERFVNAALKKKEPGLFDEKAALPKKVTESLDALNAALKKNGHTLTVEVPEKPPKGKDRKTASAGA